MRQSRAIFQQYRSYMASDVSTVDMKMPKNNSRMTLLLPALIGLMLVSFATLPQAYASQLPKTTSTSGAGYVATVSSGEFTQVTAEWNQPAITCQPSLGGGKPAEFEGVTITNATSGASVLSMGGYFLFTVGGCGLGHGAPPYFAGWVQLGVTGLNGLFPVTPGDKFSGSLTFSPSTGTVTANLTDLSTGQSVSFALPQFSTPIVFTVVGWIMTPGYPSPGVLGTLAEFNAPITFSHCSATVSGNTYAISQLSTVSRITMVDSGGNMMATTSHLGKHGSSFKVTWVSSI
jgi:hypothetical protein